MMFWHELCKRAGMHSTLWALSLAGAGMLCGSAATARAADPFAGLPDPTRPSYAQGEGGADGVSTAVHGLTLQSILIGPQRRLAVINGQRVAIGERVGDATVAAIRADAVVVRRAGGELTLRLVPRYVSRNAKVEPKPENKSHAGSP
jgi:MSHA biogenesis protein MshK